MNELEDLEKQLQKLQPAKIKHDLQARCIAYAICTKQKGDSFSWRKWVMAACVLLLFSFWKDLEHKNSYDAYYKVQTRSKKNDITNIELAEIAYSNKMLLSCFSSAAKTKESFLYHWNASRE
ncbi:MAG: hypothetical protein HUU50_03385 [Candidatus Brocadiae bacterium]|nr:hypothetical protein [Candidatus Brocadiia bacterium]